MLRITFGLYIPHKKLVPMNCRYPSELHKIFDKQFLVASHKYLQHLIHKRLRVRILHEEVDEKLEGIVLELRIDFKYLLKQTEYLVIEDLSEALNDVENALQQQDQIDFCYGVTHASNEPRCEDENVFNCLLVVDYAAPVDELEKDVGVLYQETELETIQHTDILFCQVEQSAQSAQRLTQRVHQIGQFQDMR